MFGPTVEGLFVRGLRGQLDAELKAQLRELGLDVEKPMLPAYPQTVVAGAIELIGKKLYPAEDENGRWYRIGKHVVLGVRDMPIGGAVLAFARLVGPRRALNRMPHTFRTTSNYLDCVVRERGDKRYELDALGTPAPPGYMQAVVEDILTVAGAKGLEVKLIRHAPEERLATYAIRWD